MATMLARLISKRRPRARDRRRGRRVLDAKGHLSTRTASSTVPARPQSRQDADVCGDERHAQAPHRSTRHGPLRRSSMRASAAELQIDSTRVVTARGGTLAGDADDPLTSCREGVRGGAGEASAHRTRSSPLAAAFPEAAAPFTVAVACPGRGAGAPVQWARWRRRCRACAALAVSAQTFRRLALANAVMLVVIVASRRDRPPDRVRPRLRALARLPGGRSSSRDRATTRTSSSRTASSPGSRSPPTLLTLLAALPASPGEADGFAGSRARAFLGTLAPGAARRDHRLLPPEPVARALATSCSRWSC